METAPLCDVHARCRRATIRLRWPRAINNEMNLNAADFDGQQQPPKSGAHDVLVDDIDRENEEEEDPEEDPQTTERLVSMKDVGRPANFLRGLYRFTRPHTMLGTFISVTSVTFIAFAQAKPVVDWGPLLSAWLPAVVSSLLANVAIVGFNQMCDVPIDSINKPYLPLCNGDLDKRTASAIVTSTALAALAIASGGYLLVAVASSLLLGWLYSSDTVRLKRRPVTAALCIVLVRAVIVHICFYGHAAGAARLSSSAPPALLICMAFMTAFSLAIALGKDMADTRGDEKSGIRTASLVIGNEKVFECIVALLLGVYAVCGIASVAVVDWAGWRAKAIGAAYIGAMLTLWRKSRQVSLASSSSITNFYMFLWKLFYVQYLVFPLCIA